MPKVMNDQGIDDELLLQLQRVGDVANSEDPSKAWSSLIGVAAASRKVLPSKEFLHSFSDLFYSVVSSKGGVRNIWVSIVHTYLSISVIAGESQLKDFIHGYRIAANILRDTTALPFTLSDYESTLAIGLYDCMRGIEGDEELRVFCKIYDHLPTSLQMLSLEMICTNIDDVKSKVNAMDVDWCVKATELLVKMSSRYRNSTPAGSALAMLSHLVQRACKEIKGISVAEHVLLRRASNPMVAECIINSLPAEDIVDVAGSVAALWGERIFVCKGDHSFQASLTAALLAALRRLNATDLSKPTAGGGPLAVLLSSGISTYLDQMEKQTRIRGMKVASQFSVMMGQNLVFDEVLEEEKKESLQDTTLVASSDATVSLIPGGAAAAGGIDKGRRDNNGGYPIEAGDNSDIDADTDSSDSELEAYDMEDEGSLSSTARLPNTNYLRICLEMLQKTDSAADSHDQHKAALMNIPRIVDSKPADATDICAPLMRELLLLSNSYNMEQFDELRSAAALSLLSTYPHLCLHTITTAINAESTTIGSRVYAISLLSQASFSIAGLPVPGEKTKSEMESQPTLADQTSSTNNSLPAGDVPLADGKTIVKRPLRMAALSRRRRYFRNNFGTVAKSFFFIVQTVLQDALRSSTKSVDDGIFASTSFSASIPKEFKSLAISDSNTRSASGKPPKDAFGDDLQALVIAEAVFALSSFTRCSINTVCQGSLTVETLRIVRQFRDATFPAVRKAVLVALISVLESWLHQKKRKLHHRAMYEHHELNMIGAGGESALATLTDVLGTRLRSERFTELADPEDGEIAEVVDWAVMTCKADPDRDCRAMKCEIASLAIEGFGLLEEAV